MSFLLDTDISSAYLKGNRLVANRFLQYAGGLHINVVVLAELMTWALRANAPLGRLRAVQEFVNDLTILDLTPDLALKFGQVQAHLFDRGLPMSPMDLFNAATALVHDFTLVTHNSRDYLNVPHLRMVDWLSP